MIDRYSRPEMAALFTDQARMDTWLRVEQAHLRALAYSKTAPESAADALEALSSVDVERVRQREAKIHHDLAAFVDVIAEDAPGAAGWVHYGLTSSDVVDTALGLQLHTAGELIQRGLRELADTVYAQARAHMGTVMLGRTHGMPAEVTTLGAKLAGWWHQLQRDVARMERAISDIRVGKLSGAVGTYSGVGPDVERLVLEQLGLSRDPSATQIVQRDRHAAMLASMAVLGGTLERIALEIRHLQRSEVGEVSEPFARAQKGSSAMPHKRNPIVSEQICGLARLLRANAGAALENIALWHERDISHSSIERVILPDSFLVLDHMLGKAHWLVDSMQVHADRMVENINAQRGVVASQRVLLQLIANGMSRDDAYRSVQTATASVHEDEHLTLADALARDTTVTAVLTHDQLRGLTDASWVPNGAGRLVEELIRAAAPDGQVTVVIS